jgi:hypothetical protein
LERSFWSYSIDYEVVIAMRTVFITSLGKKPDEMVEEERSKAAKRLPIIKLGSVFPEAFLAFLAGKCLVKFDKSKRRFFDST